MRLSDPDRLTVAGLSAITQRYAAIAHISGDDRIKAVAELAAEAAGRAELLAEHVGICLGFAGSAEDWAAIILRLCAELAIQAGANDALTPGWVESVASAPKLPARCRTPASEPGLALSRARAVSFAGIPYELSRPGNS